MHYVLAAAPAKINLALRVGGPRGDGYHPLDTVFEALDLFDDVEAVPGDTPGEVFFDIRGLGEDLPRDESNLVMRASRLLQKTYSAQQCSARMTITKRIPVAGGMAGGSADAAATLVALNQLWELGASHEELMELGAKLGSDVPFSLLGSVAHGTSRGEQLEAIVPGSMHGFVIMMNPTGLSTPSVFKEFDRLYPNVGDPGDTSNLRKAIEAGDLEAMGQLLENDLEIPAFSLRPDLAQIHRRCTQAGYHVILCGSGPSIALLCEVGKTADLARDMQAAFPDLSVVHAFGPAAGAHVVKSF